MPHLAHLWASCHDAHCVPQHRLGAEQVGGTLGTQLCCTEPIPQGPPPPLHAKLSTPPFPWVWAVHRREQSTFASPQGEAGRLATSSVLPLTAESFHAFSSLCQGAPGIAVAGMKVSETL